MLLSQSKCPGEELKGNENLLGGLIKSEIMVVDVILNIIRESEANLHKQFAECKESIELLNKITFKLFNELEKQRFT